MEEMIVLSEGVGAGSMLAWGWKTTTWTMAITVAKPSVSMLTLGASPPLARRIIMVLPMVP
eukprot:12408192-Karenia_brevis.AAC.1